MGCGGGVGVLGCRVQGCRGVGKTGRQAVKKGWWGKKKWGGGGREECTEKVKMRSITVKYHSHSHFFKEFSKLHNEKVCMHLNQTKHVSKKILKTKTKKQKKSCSRQSAQPS